MIYEFLSCWVGKLATGINRYGTVGREGLPEHKGKLDFMYCISTLYLHKFLLIRAPRRQKKKGEGISGEFCWAGELLGRRVKCRWREASSQAAAIRH